MEMNIFQQPSKYPLGVDTYGNKKYKYGTSGRDQYGTSARYWIYRNDGSMKMVTYKQYLNHIKSF